MAFRQSHLRRRKSPGDQSFCKCIRGVLPAAIRIGIKGHVNSSMPIAELFELASIEVSAHRAGNIAKPGLPQYGIIKQALDENDFMTLTDLFPAV